MRFKLKITKENYLDFNIYHATNTPMYIRTVVLMALMVPLMLAGLAFFMMDQIDPEYKWVWQLLMGMISIYWVVTTPSRFRRNVRKQVQKITTGHNEFIGNFSLKLQPDHLEFISSDVKVDYEYSRVDKVVWNKGCYYLLMGGVSAIIVPESSFNNQMLEQEFLDTLRDKCPQAELKF